MRELSPISGTDARSAASKESLRWAGTRGLALIGFIARQNREIPRRSTTAEFDFDPMFSPSVGWLESAT